MSAPIRWVEQPNGKQTPYSAATVHNDVVYPCGQVPVAADGSIADDIGGQVRQCFDNLERVLTSAGSGLAHLLQVTVYLADLAEFDAYNEAYLTCLSGLPLPPRTTVQVAAFRGAKRIELTAIAAVASPQQEVSMKGSDHDRA
jgi:2-iminobutanoate/2-iminopropanoate deaminase